MSKRKKTKGGMLGTVTSCISTTMVLILLGTVVAFVTIADNFGRSVRENFTVEVLLDDSIPAQELVALKARLAAKPYAKQVNYISKEQGTREMMADLGGSPEDFLGSSPIPAEYEIFLRADYANRDSLARYMPALQRHPYIKEVVYPTDLMDTMNAGISAVSAVLLIVAGLLAFVSFALINNTVRMDVYARRFSIRTMKLVGAKWSFIRRPFMRRAVISGLIAALIAGSALYGGLEALTRYNDNQDFRIVTPTVIAVTLGTILVAGLLLTLLCTFFSINRHLRMSQDDLYIK
jgi:cell division transport system permease protein